MLKGQHPLDKAMFFRSFDDVSDELEKRTGERLTRKRVEQIHNIALRKLREQLKELAA